MARFKRAFPGRPLIRRGPSPAAAPQGTPSPPRPFIARNPVPARGRVGSPANVCASGIATLNYPPPPAAAFTRGISMWR